MAPARMKIIVFLLTIIAVVLGRYAPAYGTGDPVNSDDVVELSSVDEDATTMRPNRQAVWVFSDEITEAGSTSALIAHALRMSYDRLYVSVYRSRPNARGRLVYEDDQIRRLIEQAHENGIEVWTAYGAPDWPELGFRAGSFPYDRVREVLAYNAENPSHRFDGLMLDVEPEDDSNLSGMLELYRDMLQMLQDEDLPVATSIRAFWDMPLAAPGRTEMKPAYQHVIDLPFDHVLVMCYRNFADGSNGTGAICGDEVAYAELKPNGPGIVVGLRTTSVEKDGGWHHESFEGFKPEEMERAVTSIRNHFQPYQRVLGLAFHRYERLVEAD